MRHLLRNRAVIGALGLVLLAGVVLLALNAEALPVIGGGTTYTADFTEAAGLRSGNEVRVAGVKVGKVTEVALTGGHVKVRFRVKHTWVGDASTVAIKIKTLLGDKYLAVDPLGSHEQRPGQAIPVARTTSPFDVTEAFNKLADTVGQIDTGKLAQSFEAISQTFADTPPEVRSMLQGLSTLSQTISSRDTQLAQLLAATKQVTGQLSGEDSQFQTLLADGNLLLSEVQSRRDAIGALLSGTRQLATQISGLVADNKAQLGPTLTALDTVTDVLQRNQDNLTRALALAGPYYRLVGNTVGNGRWFDTYLCGLVPNSYLAPGAGPPTGCIPPKPGSGQ
ncbi:MAG TPA: MCE family protein [Rugosimonospora sp.]